MFPDPTAATNNTPAPGSARLVAGHDGNTLRPFLVDTTGRARVVIDQAPSIAISNFPPVQAVAGAVSVTNLPVVQHVVVDNPAASQAVTGSVSVTNLPATQAVSGTVSVGNFPATQAVAGTVAVSNLPATQPTRAEAADRARAGAMFSASTSPVNPSNVAATALAVFTNPAGSGKTCYLDAWAVATATIAFVQVTTGPTVTSAGTATTATRRNPGVAATPVASLSAGPTLSANGTLERAGWTAAGASLGEECRGSWVVPPGSSVAFIAQNATLVAGLFGQATVRVQWWEG